MVRVILHKETKHNALNVDLLGFKPPICCIARFFMSSIFVDVCTHAHFVLYN